jgi:hypothetical protein
MRYILLLSLVMGLAGVFSAQEKWQYVAKPSRQEAIRAALSGRGLPTLERDWYWIGPFDNSESAGFDRDFIGEAELTVDLKKQYKGKDPQEPKLAWKKADGLHVGTIFNIKKLIPDSDNTVVYFYHEIELKADQPELMPLRLGSDDTLSVWLNGKRLIHENYGRPCVVDSDEVELALKPGKNSLLIKICNGAADFQMYAHPELPKSCPKEIVAALDKAFPVKSNPSGQENKISKDAEAKHYKMLTIPLENDCVMEVGGLAFRPDGKLLACTRRGEIWLIHNPLEEDLKKIRMTKFATGLHESLGMCVIDNNTVYVCQRPELTKLVDKDGDGVADEYTTFCDKWGCSGDYHEFVFGPARDKDGNLPDIERGFRRGPSGEIPLARLVREDQSAGGTGTVCVWLAFPQRGELQP